MRVIKIVQDGNVDDSIYPVTLDNVPVDQLDKSDLLWVIHEMSKKLAGGYDEIDELNELLGLER